MDANRNTFNFWEKIGVVVKQNAHFFDLNCKGPDIESVEWSDVAVQSSVDSVKPLLTLVKARARETARLKILSLEELSSDIDGTHCSAYENE